MLLMVSGIFQAHQGATPAAGIDFYQFWVVGRAIARTHSVDIYSEQARRDLGGTYLLEALHSSSARQRAVAHHRSVLETTATPFLYTVIGAICSDDYDASLNRFRVILIAAFTLSVAGFTHLMGYPALIAVLALALLSKWFEPLASDLRVGNVGSFQLLQVLVYAHLRLRLGARVRDWSSGVWLGLALAFKPNLAPLALLLLLWPILIRDWSACAKTAGGIILGGIGAVALSTCAVGSRQTWFDWVNALRAIPAANITTSIGNFSPLEVLRPFAGAATPALVGACGLSLVTWAVVTRLRARRQDPNQTLHARESGDLLWLLAVGALSPILLVRLAWLHYFVLATPALLYGLSCLGNRLVYVSDRAAMLLVIGAWLGLAVNPLSWLGSAYTMQGYGVMVVMSTMALLGALCAAPPQIRNSIATPSPPTS
jgi:hypothetical protein